jgi:hypothetical protein
MGVTSIPIPDEIKKLQSNLNLARQLLASEVIEQYAKGENPLEHIPYPSEITEVQGSTPRRIYPGTVNDLETGTGPIRSTSMPASLELEDQFLRQ